MVPLPVHCLSFYFVYIFSNAPQPIAKSEVSSTTEDEFYVVDSPVYPGYNGYFDDQTGRRIYDNRRVIRGVTSDDIGSTAP